MKKVFMSLGGLVVVVGLAAEIQPAEAEADDVAAVAEAYLECIEDQDWERMGGLLTGTSRYEDFTMEFFDRPPIQLDGRDAIVEFWRSSSEDSGTSEIDYEIVRRIVAGPMAILDLRGRVTVAGRFWELKAEEITFEFDQITTLRIVEGRVVHHVDHVDYADGMRQVEDQRRRETGRK